MPVQGKVHLGQLTKKISAMNPIRDYCSYAVMKLVQGQKETIDLKQQIADNVLHL